MTLGLPLGPHPSNAFAFALGLLSFWLATLQCLCLDSWASFLLARNLATPCLGREPKARVVTTIVAGLKMLCCFCYKASTKVCAKLGTLGNMLFASQLEFWVSKI
jgi:hypothetical protein